MPCLTGYVPALILALCLLVFAGVALPAVWSAQPTRRQAAAAVLAQLLTALRGPGSTGPCAPALPLCAGSAAPAGHQQAHPDPNLPDAEARDTHPNDSEHDAQP
ncbi:hypothetical protein CLM62_09495 [Streptomyces sp. SA15]|uniref:hypothetical protein n=1 Tax=Streptomyces sp. SA15 TaxID=934019 RepID=UPI000BAF22D3|nr:hypothetical protein [Streptomyces sp. SA15]PAZ16215.1 hypothetical protein CLM62_09495 [Streptomyces sp. SA15]